MQDERKIVVIGAGAAGMMAAISAARRLRENGQPGQIFVLEQNEKSGKKIYLTGKGRCNLTNAAQMEEVKRQVIRNPKFLYSAFHQFTNQDVMDFFEKAGLHLKVERGNRVFPESDKSSDVIRALNQEMKRLGVAIEYQRQVKGLWVQENRICGVCLKNGRKIKADRVILATGGLAYPVTGSTGDGYRFAREIGHTVQATRPSLVPLECPESWVRSLQGLALKNVTVSLWKEGRKLYEEFGEMLFTHFGVSGPVILSASSVAGDAILEGDVTLHLDLKPALTAEQLDQRILRDMESMKQRAVKTCLEQLLPKSLIPAVMKLSGIEPEKKVNGVTKEERRRLGSVLKSLPIKVSGLRGYGEAVITKGGITTGEVNPKTMESKLVGGLYFAGEILDVDAMTGGFNLQIAWSTGFAAGRAAAGI